MVDVSSGERLDFGVGCGTPNRAGARRHRQRCIDIIRRWQDALGLTVISETFYFGGMPQEMALRSIHRFAAEAMPAFAKVEAIAQ